MTRENPTSWVKLSITTISHILAETTFYFAVLSSVFSTFVVAVSIYPCERVNLKNVL